MESTDNRVLRQNQPRMKTKKLIYIGLLLFCMAEIIGCKKEASEKIAKPIDPVTEFKKLTPENSFNWANDRNISFEVIPLSIPIAISNTLSIYNKDKSELIYTAQIEMGKSFSTKLKVPANTHELMIQYGSIENIVPIIGDQIKFDFVTFDITE